LEDSKKYLIPLSGRQIVLIIKALRVADIGAEEETEQYGLYKMLLDESTKLK
jgi:hypothetical protein